MPMGAGVLFGAVLGASICGIWLYALRHVIRYEVKAGMVRIRLFDIIPIRTIRSDEVIDVTVVPAWPWMRGFRLSWCVGEVWPSRVFSRRAVLMRKSCGFTRIVLLTPSDPEQFVRDVRHSLNSAGPSEIHR